MAREAEALPRFDFRGGTNTSFSADVLGADELRLAQNARLTYGNVEKRAGTQRIHTATIGAGNPVMGLYQWDAPGGKQVVAVSNGNFYHKLGGAADFTEVVSALSTVKRSRFVPYRTGAAIKLMFADGALRSWDGAALVTAIAGAPAAEALAIYKLRMFAIAGTKTLYASKVGDPTVWAPGSGGLFADVETFDSEPLVGLLVVGSSLLCFKHDNIARFTGVDTNNIRLDIESEGVSSEVGLVATDTLVRFEDVGFFLSNRGPYVVSESGVQEAGLKIQREFDFANHAVWQNAVAVHHQGRREIWLSIPAGAAVRNTATWIYSYRTQVWSGPHVFPFDVSVASRYERSDLSESVLIGGYDGRVRDGDVPAVGAKDDVLVDGTLGANITMDVQLPPILGGDPTTVKRIMGKAKVEADLKAVGLLEAYWSSELGASSVTIPSKGAGVKNYPYKLQNAKGARVVHGFRDATSEIVSVNGVLPAIAMGRKGR